MLKKIHFGNEQMRLARIKKIKNALEASIKSEKPENVRISTSLFNLVENFQEVKQSILIERIYIAEHIETQRNIVSALSLNSMTMVLNTIDSSLTKINNCISKLRAYEQKQEIELYKDIVKTIDETLEGYTNLTEYASVLQYTDSEEFYHTIVRGVNLFQYDSENRNEFISRLLSRIVEDTKDNRKINYLEINKRFLPNVFPREVFVSDKLANYCVLSDDVQYETKTTISKGDYERLIKASIKTCTISNKAFDIVYALLFDFMFGSVHYGEDDYGRVEEAIREEDAKNMDVVDRLLRYVKPEGIVTVLLPEYKINNKICTAFAKTLDNVVKVRHYLNEVPYLYIIGKRKKDVSDKELNPVIYKALRYDDVDDIENIEKFAFINLDNLQNNVVTDFRTYLLTDEEATEFLDTIDTLSQVATIAETVKQDIDGQRPLLPFNIGQIGIVLTSGCLDGAVVEEDGIHLVKGKIIRSEEEKIEKEKSGKGYRQEKIYSNKVSINILLPDGRMRSLV